MFSTEICFAVFSKRVQPVNGPPLCETEHFPKISRYMICLKSLENKLVGLMQ